MSTTEQKALALRLADEQETLLLEVANGERKPGKLPLEPFVRGAVELRRLSAENEALRAREGGLITALAECRDVFQMPKPGAELESIWGQAMGDPESVPGYVKAQVDALRAQVEVLTKPQNPVAWKFKHRDWDSWHYKDWSPDSFGEDADEYLKIPLYRHPTSSPLTRPAVPEGWKMVPVEPTPEMAKAGCYRFCAAFVQDYCAMIAAAPQPEAQPTEAAQPTDWRAAFDVWWSENRVKTHNLRSAEGFSRKAFHAGVLAAQKGGV